MRRLNRSMKQDQSLRPGTTEGEHVTQTVGQMQDGPVEDRSWRVAVAIARLSAAGLDDAHDVGQVALQPAKRTPVRRGAAPGFGQARVVFGQAGKGASLCGWLEAQVRPHKAACYGVKLVAAGVVRRRPCRLEERRLEQLVEGHVRGLAPGREQR